MSSILSRPLTFLKEVRSEVNSLDTRRADSISLRASSGISLIIFIGIIARFPHSIVEQFQFSGNIIIWLILLALLITIIAGVVLVTQGTRRIPVQYAKRVVGRKVYGGVTQYIPMRVNTAGVMPIIFAQSIMFIPQTIATFFPDSEWMQNAAGYF